MCDIQRCVERRLFAMRDLKYRDFNSALIPSVPREAVIGVRTPDLRRYAGELSGTPEAESFLLLLPHRYYEENNLHGFLIERLRDYDRVICELERFLPYIDNWATCDCVSPPVFKRHLPQLRERCRRWMESGHTYTVRFGIGMLMRHFLDDAFSPEYPDWVASVQSEEYYIKMMAAWYFATALAKQYDAALPYLTQRRLDPWTHNKAIQKAVESRRVSPEQKQFLRTLKVK